jgi:hypothetical protein
MVVSLFKDKNTFHWWQKAKFLLFLPIILGLRIGSYKFPKINLKVFSDYKSPVYFNSSYLSVNLVLSIYLISNCFALSITGSNLELKVYIQRGQKFMAKLSYFLIQTMQM